MKGLGAVAVVVVLFLFPHCCCGIKLRWMRLRVRSYIWNLGSQIAVEWQHECCHVVLPCASKDADLQSDVSKRIVMGASILHGLRFGNSLGTKPCAFPCKVAPAGDERYLVCAAGAVAVVVVLFLFRTVAVASSCCGCDCVCAPLLGDLESWVADRSGMAA